MEQEPKEYADSFAKEANEELADNNGTNEEVQVLDSDVTKEMKKSRRRSIIKDLITYAIIFFVCLYIIPTYVIQKTIVDGPSMEDTLHNGDQLMVEKISYHLDGLKRFDIIVFYPYGRENKEYYVKRVIGLPGETVQIKGEDIYINDKKISEHYGKEPITKAGIAANPITLAEDEYFVMGDNREVSFDSRYEEVGPVKKDNIGGKVILRVWPLNKFGLLE
ncbi:signal peptidase I [Anaerocolumna xylanovorans]|uniref:Signal peptidase I n=1 Tax=Anaerocolumna xylanovorans DSM 12503 TaxID=1121345 RepID=A0A1M7YLZ5_9FIRM|nr:signal peptidase I [Anaerocolumna xylanovorans]SHO53612.1 signal peptidase I [Anaerocolumna xylanovorans DSM 12503]